MKAEPNGLARGSLPCPERGPGMSRSQAWTMHAAQGCEGVLRPVFLPALCARGRMVKAGFLMAGLLLYAAGSWGAPPPRQADPHDPCRPWEARMGELQQKRQRFAWNEPTFARRVEQARARFEKDVGPGGRCPSGAQPPHSAPAGHRGPPQGPGR